MPPDTIYPLPVQPNNDVRLSKTKRKHKTRDKVSGKNSARFAGLKTTLNARMAHPNDNNKKAFCFIHAFTGCRSLIHPQAKTHTNNHKALNFTISSKG